MNLYRCEICSKPFKRKGHLIRHKRSHSSDRPFTCPVCVRSFTRQDSLLRHLSSHAKPPTRGRRKQTSCDTQPNDVPDPATVNEDSNGDTPAREMGNANQLQIADTEQLFLDANTDHEADLDIPPELVNKREKPAMDISPASPGIVGPKTGSSDFSTMTNDFYTHVGGPSTHNRTSPQSIDAGQALGTSELLETYDWPDALYSSTVDRHARNWLREFSAREPAGNGG